MKRVMCPRQGTAPRGERALGAMILAGLCALTAVVGGCGDDTSADGRITAVIVSVTPEAGFAPAEIDFVGDFEAIEDVVADDVQVSWDFGDGSGSSGSFSVSHTFQQPGTYEVTMTVRELSGGTERDADEASIDVVIYPPADLRVTTPFVSDRAVRSQDDLRITFDLFSEAAEVPVPFEIGIYLAEPGVLNPVNPPDTDALGDLVLQGRAHLIDTVAFPNFGGEGATTNVDRTAIRVPAQVPSGQYQVVVYADHDGVVGELDEQNNVSFSAQPLDFINTTTEGPDLTVRNVRARPSRANILETLTVDFDLANPGTEAAVLFDYEVYLSFANDILEESDELIASDSVDGVTAGQETAVDDLAITLSEPRVTIGNYFVLVVADSGDVVEEPNEANNVGVSGPIIVTDEPIPGTDLIPTDFSFDPLTSFLDGSITLRASVINQGSEDAPRQFFCRVYLSEDDELDTVQDSQLDTINFPVLSAGEELEQTKLTLIPGFFDPGLYYLFLFCDPNFQIPEADEDNNVLQADGRLEISTDPEIDLRFGSFDIQPRTVANEGEVHIDMSVCNDGTNGSGPSVVRVQISADTQLDSTDTVLLEQALAPINADSCVDVSVTVPAVCDTFQPNYTVFANLDVTSLIPEINEENNNVVLDTPLTIEGVICECEIDILESNADGNNNSPATPTFVSDRTYRDLTMCDQAVDWYAIPLLAGETVRAIITFENARGNLDMTLFAADRATILDSSTSNGDREEVIAFVVPETGDYLLKVFGRTAFDVNAYEMSIEVTPPQSGTDLIVTNVNLSKTSPVLAEPVDVTFDVINLGDVGAGTNTVRLYISQDITIDPAEDPQLGEIVLTDVPAVSLRRRTVTVTMPGEGPGGNRYIGVVADVLNQVPGEIDETNNTGLSDLFFLDAGCFDPLEPNNSLDDAYAVSLTGEVTTLSGLLVCTDNRDFYQICGLAGDFLTMTSRFDGEAADVDMTLYSTSGTQLDRAEGTGSEEVLSIDYLSVDQCFVLEVLVIGRDQEVPYELIVETGDAPPELQCSGTAEPNEGFSSSKPLGDFLDSDLAICPVTDIDFFRLNVAAGTALEFRFLPVEGQASVPTNLRMSLWSPSKTFLTNTVSATEPLIFTTTTGGPSHYLRVTSLASGPRNSQYRIDVQGLDGIDLQPIDFAITPGIVRIGERVQYTVTLANNRTLPSGPFSYGVYLSEDAVLEPGERIKEVDEDELAGTSSREVGGKVTIPVEGVTQGQLHFLGIFVDFDDAVDEFEESNNITILPLQIEAACALDPAEPNDVRADWADLANFVGANVIDLELCTDDIDWFRYDVSASTGYTFTSELMAGEGDLDLFVWDSDLALMGSGETLSSEESVTITTAADDVFVYVEVVPFGVTNLTYRLTATP